MPKDVDELWAGIVGWLELHAPATARGIRPPADDSAEDHCGQTVFVDLRDGPRHGCVGVWDHESAWDDAISRESITDMLTDVRNALVREAAD